MYPPPPKTTIRPRINIGMRAPDGFCVTAGTVVVATAPVFRTPDTPSSVPLLSRASFIVVSIVGRSLDLDMDRSLGLLALGGLLLEEGHERKHREKTDARQQEQPVEAHHRS